jgi:mannose-1-phosphate guanylyltransferase/phosphomannomutase
VHIRLSPFDHRVVDIKFFTKDGLDIEKNAERKIEQTFFREDFRRANSDEIGGITETPQLVEIYEAGFRRSVSPMLGSPGAKRTTVVVDYAHGTASQILPGLLGDLGMEVISLNAALDEDKLAVDPGALEQSMQLLGRIAVAVNADFGVRLEVGGEKLFAVDDQGRQLESPRLAAAVASLVFEQQPGAAVVVPVSAPRVFEEMAARFGGRVVRTRVNQQALMAAGTESGVALVADMEGGIAFPAFHPAFDGLFAIVKLEEMLSRAGRRLSSVADSLPSFAIARRTVHCEWSKKGRVMRQLNEQYRERQTEQVDGVRIDLGREWVLILPDADRPLFHIIAESRSADGASDLVEKYAGLVDGMQRGD